MSTLMDETLPWGGPGQSLCPLACLWQRRILSQSVLWRALRDLYRGGGQDIPLPHFVCTMCGTCIGKVYEPEGAHIPHPAHSPTHQKILYACLAMASRCTLMKIRALSCSTCPRVRPRSEVVVVHSFEPECTVLVAVSYSALHILFGLRWSHMHSHTYMPSPHVCGPPTAHSLMHACAIKLTHRN